MSSMELEFVPQERQHPRLTGTELRPIENVLNDPEATERGLTREYAQDPDFRAHVAVFKKGYQKLVESGPVTEERLHRLIDHLYVTNAIERHAEFLNSRDSSITKANFDIMFCTYLDLAMPIDPMDRVTPDQAQNGKLYWMDHVLRQAENLAYRQHYGVEIPEQTEEIELTPSEKLLERLAEAREANNKKARIDTIALLGSSAVFPIVELVSVPELATKASLSAAVIAMGASVLRWAGRRFSIMELDDRAKNAERDESLRAMLPAISPNVTVSQAISGLQYELETLEAAKKNGTASLVDTSEKTMAINAVLSGLRWARIDDTSVGHLYWLARDLASLTQDRTKKYKFVAKQFETMAQMLNRYLPIDQEADTITPVDEFTGEKTWQQFAKRVAAGDDRVSLDKLDAAYF